MRGDLDYCSRPIRPRGDNVLVKLEPPPRETASGLALPQDLDSYRPIDAVYATIVAVGDGPAYKSRCPHCLRPRYPFADELSPGDRVVLDSKAAGERVTMPDGEHRIVRMAEIHAVVEQ